MLTESENEYLQVLLENLTSVRKSLNERAQSFLDETVARHEQWGNRIKLSPKQWAWLEGLHKDKCPNDVLPDRRADEIKFDDDEIDDEIRF